MAQDWGADVRRYAPDAADGEIAGIVRHCGIALHKPDSAMVAMSDPTETARVRDNFCKKKLGLTHSDAELDVMIGEVGQRMKDDRTKNRVTVYYLLAQQAGKLDMFVKPPAAGKGATTSASALPASVAGAATLGLAGAAMTSESSSAAAMPASAAPPPPPSPIRAAPPIASAPPPPPSPPADPLPMAVTPTTGFPGGQRFVGSVGTGERSGMGSMLWPLLLLGVIFLLFWLALGHRSDDAAVPIATATTETVATTATVETSAVTPPAALTAIPTGAGVISEMRGSVPAANVYFATGKADVAPAFAAAAATLKAHLEANAGAKLSVSGFNDKTGNAAANAELAKDRAQAVQAALVAAGIPAASVELAKPADTTDTATSNEGARRVEVTAR